MILKPVCNVIIDFGEKKVKKNSIPKNVFKIVLYEEDILIYSKNNHFLETTVLQI